MAVGRGQVFGGQGVRGKAPERQPPKPKSKTVEYRNWRGVNLTDARAAIDDEELAYAENAVTVGKGAIQLTPAQGASIATISAGVASLHGFNLTLAGVSTPVLISINSDGSATQIKQDGTQTVITTAGNLTTAAQLAIFRDTTILFEDPTKGYCSWDGAAFAVIDATKLGNAIAVFEARVWLGKNRTVTFTAPNSFSNFTGADGAGTTVITDEAFPGTIIAFTSALEQLWIAGQAAFEAIANVSTTGGTTTFSITNIVSGIGTNNPNSVIGYFRALVFSSPTGIFALSGVTPQKLSDKLDGMYPALTLSPDVPAAIGTVQNLLVLCFLVTYTQANAPSLPTPASGLSTATKLLLCFTQGKWFFATQGSLTWITTLVNAGVSEVWGTDGSTIFKVFGGGTGEVAYKIVSKFFSFGTSTTKWQILKSGLEIQASGSVSPQMTIDNEFSSETEAVSAGNTLTFLNAAGNPLSFLNGSGAALTFVAQGLILSRTVSNMYGHYLGASVSGTDSPYRIQAIQLEYAPAGEWVTP